eukprot:TRINITY_DN258_c0_g1_i1.p1 TRINITY_DN258_c0_g1~~TRINITY_DN258_c0_g1_i1.p1  ORF type:complete len:429 (-),score=82.45 TRINITY_DN258_c0_g1_i1:387-1643(-)
MATATGLPLRCLGAAVAHTHPEMVCRWSSSVPLPRKKDILGAESCFVALRFPRHGGFTTAVALSNSLNFQGGSDDLFRCGCSQIGTAEVSYSAGVSSPNVSELGSGTAGMNGVSGTHSEDAVSAEGMTGRAGAGEAVLDGERMAGIQGESTEQDEGGLKKWEAESGFGTRAPPAEDTATDEQRVLLQAKGRELVADLRGASIFLVGMMGSGKTTVGKILANALGYCFFDSDALVEMAAGGASISQIFLENGEEAFRDAEAEAIAQLSTMGRLVVATGGGAVIRQSNWSHMRDAITVWLHVPVPALASRVAAAGGGPGRPLLLPRAEWAALSAAAYAASRSYQEIYDEALVRLQAIWYGRHRMYENADAKVSLHSIAQEQDVDALAINPARIALEVLLQIEVLVRERKERDQSLAYRQQ